MVPFSPVSSFQHLFLFLFFFNDTATTEIYTLSLHDALPISSASPTVIWNCTTSWCAPALFRRFSWTSRVPSELLLVRKQSGSSAARAIYSNCCVSRFISNAASGVNTGGLLANHWRTYRSCLTRLLHFQLVWMRPIAVRCPVRVGIDSKWSWLDRCVSDWSHSRIFKAFTRPVGSTDSGHVPHIRCSLGVLFGGSPPQSEHESRTLQAGHIPRAAPTRNLKAEVRRINRISYRRTSGGEHSGKAR